MPKTALSTSLFNRVKKLKSKSGAIQILIIGLVILLLGIAFAVYQLIQQNKEVNPKYTGPRSSIKIAVGKVTVSAPIFIADKKGFFHENGLDVELVFFSSGKLALDSLLSGEVDYAATGETPVALAILKDEKIQIITEFSSSVTELALVANRESGISNEKDLNGKKIGVTKNTTGEFFLSSLLLVNNIKENELEIIDVKAKDRFDALITGKVDGQVALNPDVINMQTSLGDKAITFTGNGIYRQVQSLITNQETVNLKLNELERLSYALISSQEFINNNPEEAIEIVAQRLIRKICENCRVSASIQIDEFRKHIPELIIARHFDTKSAAKQPTVTTYSGKGCDVCHSTGYTGRIGLFEVLEVTDAIKNLITTKADAGAIAKKAVEEGMLTMLDDGIEKVKSGATTLEEILRATKI